jgi:nucleotide exchange factor SIL1
MFRYVSGCLLGVACLGMAIATQPAAPSPSAHTELICPTDNPTDCFPRIFQPTEDFQIVREGQDLPPGLHVRMNVWTGEKEARLNIPMAGDVQLEGLPTEQSVVVVDQPEDGSMDDEPALRDRVPQKPPAYDVVGKILPPREPDGSGGDSENFWNAIRVLDGGPVSDEDIELALTDLSDLAHDIYYGVELAKRGDVLQSLVALMSSDSHSPQQRRQAASVLGGSVQNNPTALKEARKAWESSTYPNSGKIYRDKRVCEPENLFNLLHQSLRQETDPAVTRAKISALAGLTKDPDMRDCFVANLGMEHLLSIFLKEGNQWDSTRVKIAQFVMDTFLDEDMGAQLGIWPRSPAMDSQNCRDPVLGANQNCWEYHLQKMEQEQGDGTHEWLSEFLRLLRRSMDALPGTGRHTVDREL